MPHASELCTDCGICCNGTLFSSVTLDAAAIVTARAHHLPILETASECRLELPCPALHGVLCGIYEDRPEPCADYACELLLSVHNEELSFDDAREIIEHTRTIHERVVEEVGIVSWWTARRTALDSSQELSEDLETLERLVRVHFWGDP